MQSATDLATGSWARTAAVPWWRMAVNSVAPPVLISAICGLGAGVNYLLFHTLAEFFSIVIAMVAMVVVTTSQRFTRNHFVVYIAVAIGWCGGLDLVHMLIFKGMDLLPSDSTNPAIQMWVAARLIQSVALVTAPLLLNRSVRLLHVQAGFGGAALLSVALIATGHFPTAYVDGQGLTPFKIYSEYLIIGLLACALALLWRHRTLMSTRLLANLLAAVVFMIASELAFTRYASVYAPANIVGHLFKIFAYWYVYLALVHSTLREPFSMLARAASTYDAVPDPTLIVSADGTIQQANTAAALHAGQAAELLVGQSSHALFHDPATSPADCPVCQGQKMGGSNFKVEIECTRGPQGLRAIECSVAPFKGHHENGTFVQVVRDITDRRRLATEREALVLALGERIKELRCMHAIAQLVETPGLQLAPLLQGVIDRLPPGFMHPDQVRVAITGDWGQFGAPTPEPRPAQWMERAISVHGSPRARLQAWYLPAKDVALLPEEQALLDSVAQQIGRTIEHMQAAEKAQRLSNLYEMLSATNHAVVHSSDQETLLARLYDTLITHGAFPMMFIALTETGGFPLRMHRTHGIAPEHLPLLTQTLQDPQSPFNEHVAGLVEGGVKVHSIAPDAGRNPWLAHLHQQGMQERALMPLVCDGRLLGAVALYARGLTTFDADEIRLLTEMASDLSFAFNRLAADKRLRQAEQRAQLSEHRFSEVFDASPLPMLIYSLGTRQLRTCNRALQQWLGYTPEDIATLDKWAERVYADPAVRSQVMARWEIDVSNAQGGRLNSRPNCACAARTAANASRAAP